LHTVTYTARKRAVEHTDLMTSDSVEFPVRISSAYARTRCAWPAGNLGSWFQTRISTIRDLLGFGDYRHQSVGSMDLALSDLANADQAWI